MPAVMWFSQFNACDSLFLGLVPRLIQYYLSQNFFSDYFVNDFSDQLVTQGIYTHWCMFMVGSMKTENGAEVANLKIT